MAKPKYAAPVGSTDKTCVRCGETKDRGDFHKRAIAFDGLNAGCKDCMCAARRARTADPDFARNAKKARLEAQALTGKGCTRCGELKPLDSYSKRSSASDGHQSVCKVCVDEYRQAWYEANREACLQQSKDSYVANRAERVEQHRAWYEANRERQNARGKKWREANRERATELVREWRAANRDRALANERRWRDENRERLNEQDRALYSANPERMLEKRARRRAALQQGMVGPVDLEALWTGACGICAERMDRDIPHPHPLSKSVDHIIPLSRGGSHKQSNLQWAHLRCNVSKGAKLPDTGEGVA